MLQISRSALVAVVLAMACLGAVVVTGTSAAAHTELRASTPAQGATVETLASVSLEFSGPLLEIGTELAIRDAAGDEHVLQPEHASATEVTAPVAQDIAAGEALLQWRVVAEDGHPIEGVIEFAYAPSTPVEPSPEPTATETATTEPSPTPSAVVIDAPIDLPADEPATTGVPWWVWVVVALGAAGTAGIALAASRARR